MGNAATAKKGDPAENGRQLIPADATSSAFPITIFCYHFLQCPVVIYYVDDI